MRHSLACRRGYPGPDNDRLPTGSDPPVHWLRLDARIPNGQWSPGSKLWRRAEALIVRWHADQAGAQDVRIVARSSSGVNGLSATRFRIGNSGAAPA